MTDEAFEKYMNARAIICALAQSDTLSQSKQLWENAISAIDELFAYKISQIIPKEENTHGSKTDSNNT